MRITGWALAATLTLLPTLSAHADTDPLSAETGGHAGNYDNAATEFGTNDVCTINFSVVTAGALAPVKSGYQVALDKQVNVNNPASYNIHMGAPGQSTFAGGALKDVTADVHDGVLTIAGPPADFDLELVFGPDKSASALIHRHCFGATTKLFYVIDNPTTGVMGGDWLWVKGGKR